MNLMRVTNRDIVYDFFRAILGLSRTDDFRGVLFVPEHLRGQRGTMEAVSIAVGYNAFNGRTCSMHAVIQRPEDVSRSVVSEVFEFPFKACQVEHVIAPVESTNTAALDFDRRLGFKELHRFPGGALNGSDLVILTMAKDDCRWIRRTLQ